MARQVLAIEAQAAALEAQAAALEAHTQARRLEQPPASRELPLAARGDGVAGLRVAAEPCSAVPRGASSADGGASLSSLSVRKHHTARGTVQKPAHQQWCVP
eukprot:COSAG01_NODE_5540_length_4196_cov_28.824262_4_plen_102_part_00